MRLLTMSLVTASCCLLGAGSASAAVTPNLKAPTCIQGIYTCIPVDRDDVEHARYKACDVVCVLDAALGY